MQSAGKLPPKSVRGSGRFMNRAKWERLERVARHVVEEAVNELPREIRDVARGIPCLFQEWSKDDRDLLGVYCDFAAGEMSPANGPIILYLGALDEFCADEGEDFATEVRLTFLHELGHHFGWDEDDLDARGLA
jgi:predicted Zn-dependent protease with MMP-like domain